MSSKSPSGGVPGEQTSWAVNRDLPQSFQASCCGIYKTWCFLPLRVCERDLVNQAYSHCLPELPAEQPEVNVGHALCGQRLLTQKRQGGCLACLGLECVGKRERIVWEEEICLEKGGGGMLDFEGRERKVWMVKDVGWKAKRESPAPAMCFPSHCYISQLTSLNIWSSHPDFLHSQYFPLHEDQCPKLDSVICWLSLLEIAAIYTCIITFQ